MRKTEPTITIASCPAQYYRATDDLALLHALQRHGIQATIASWNDPCYRWEAADLVVIRSTWDYYQQRQAFLHWARKVACQTILLNPLPLVEWNSHKHYLRELEVQGIPIVPTIWNTPSQPEPMLRDLLAQRGWRQAVLKPAIAAASFGLCLVSMEDETSLQVGQEHLVQMRARGYPMMMQPFYASVAQQIGEHSLIAIAGQFTHAIRRVCPLHPDLVGHEIAIPLQEEEVRFARSVLARLPATFFARVDMVRDEVGHLRLSELEVIEPQLFFAFNTAACDTLAAVLADLAHHLLAPSTTDPLASRGSDLEALLPARHVRQHIVEDGRRVRPMMPASSPTSPIPRDPAPAVS